MYTWLGLVGATASLPPLYKRHSSVLGYGPLSHSSRVAGGD